MMAPLNKCKVDSKSIFINYSPGLVSSRDAWVYNFNKDNLKNNIESTIDFYNYVVDSNGSVEKNSNHEKTLIFYRIGLHIINWM